MNFEIKQIPKYTYPSGHTLFNPWVLYINGELKFAEEDKELFIQTIEGLPGVKDEH